MAEKNRGNEAEEARPEEGARSGESEFLSVDRGDLRRRL
jgi:hypothetical protein